MRPVEELQRDVLHLLLVDHAEVQAVVHVVLAQGPAPHARRHLAPFPSASAQLWFSRGGAARGGPAASRRGEAAEGRSAAPASPRGGARPAAPAAPRAHAVRKERNGGGGGAESHRPFEQALGRAPFCPPPPLPPAEWSRPSWGRGEGHARGLGRAPQRREGQVRRWRIPSAAGLRGGGRGCGAAAVGLAFPRAALAACGAARPQAGCRQRPPGRGGLQGAASSPALWRGVRRRLRAGDPVLRGGSGGRRFRSRLGCPRAPEGAAVVQGSGQWRSEPAPLLGCAAVCHACKALKQLLSAL